MIMKSSAKYNLKTKDELVSELKVLHIEKEKLKRQLNERTKELHSVYKISSIMDQQNLSLPEIFQKIVDIIPPGWQYPEITCARIIIGSSEYKTSNFKDSQWKQSEIISVEDQPNGFIEVSYIEKMPDEDDGPFLKEERNLLKVMAERLGKIAARKLLEKEFEAIFRESPVAKCIIDLDNNYQLTEVNEVFLKLTGYSREELIGERTDSIGLFRDEKTITKIHNEINKYGYIKNFQYDYDTKQGKIRTIILNAKEIDVHGKNLVIATFYEQTELIALKKAEKEAIELNKVLVDSLPFGMEIVDESGCIIFANNVLKKIFGEDIVGQKCWHSYRKDDKPCPGCPLVSGIKIGEISIIETDGIKGDLIFNISHVGFNYKGKKVFLKLFDDVTKKQKAERELIETKEKLERILNNLDDAFVEANQEGIVTYINPVFIKMFAYKSSDEIIGKPVVNLYAKKEDREKLHHELREKGKVLDKTLLANRKDSSTFWVSLSVRMDHDENGNLIGTKGVIRDITQRKKIEDDFININHKLQSILDDMDDAYVEANLEGIVTYINPAFIKMFAYKSYEEIIGMPAISLYAEKDDRLKLHRKLQEKGKILDKTLLAIRKDSSTFWVSLSIRMDYDENGNLIGTKGVIRDITQRKKTEDELVEVNHKLQGILDNMDDAFFQIGLTGNITYTNAAAAKIYGYTSINELIGRPILDLYADKNDRDRALADIKKDGRIHDWNAQGLRKDGSQFWASLNGKFMYDENGTIIGSQAVARDIDSRKKIENLLEKAKERAEESDRLKTAFLLNISHEIRTPMNGILGFMGFLKEPDLSEAEKSEFIKIINKSGDRLMNTINDIVEISKIEIGDIHLHYEHIVLSEIMQYHYNFFHLQTKEKGLSFEITNQIELTLKTDKHKLDGILMNLIRNAIKFTDNGKIEIGNYIKDDFVCFYVSDSGSGIPNDKLELIFDRFVQADAGLNRGYEGSGIGLSIVKSYTEALNGRIEVKSEVGKGSTFIVSIPYIQEEKTYIDIPKEATLKSNQSKSTILIAEDDEVNFLYIEKILSEEYKIIHAENGEESVRIYNEYPDISAVLMDIKMPGKFDGLEAIRKIREINKNVSIIAQTAFAMDIDKKNVFDAGCDAFIAKPFKEEELINLVKKVLNQ